jgi:hypothetical protein
MRSDAPTRGEDVAKRRADGGVVALPVGSLRFLLDSPLPERLPSGMTTGTPGAAIGDAAALHGRRVAVGPVGSGSALTAQIVLTALGIDLLRRKGT